MANRRLMRAFFSSVLLILFSLQLNAANYYISPTGSDDADGATKQTAFATFEYAVGRLNPGDVLTALDGTYYDGIAPQNSGSLGAPITIQAENRGKAIIQMQEAKSAIDIYSSSTDIISYITIDGFILRGYGEVSTVRVNSVDNTPLDKMTSNIIIKNVGAYGSANLTNTSVFSVSRTRDSLVEDVFSYGFGRKAMQVFGCDNITVRRAVLRYDYWDGSGYKPNDPRINFSGYNTHNSIFENIIALDSAPTPAGRSATRAGFVASGNDTAVSSITSSENNKYRGIISINNVGNGIMINGGSGDPNKNISFSDVLSWGNTAFGINVQGNDDGLVISNGLTGKNLKSGTRINPNPNFPIINVKFDGIYSVDNGMYGIYYNDTQVISAVNLTATGNVYGGDVNPELAPTINNLVDSRANNRGVQITKRYNNGSLTSSNLWPWPNESLIRQHMCDSTDLAALGRNTGDGWTPGWCASGKTLTNYIQEYAGAVVEEASKAAPLPPEGFSATKI